METTKKIEVYTDTIGQKIGYISYGICEAAARIAIPQIVGNKIEKGIEEIFDAFGWNKTVGTIVSTAGGLAVKIGTAGIMGHVITPLNDVAPGYSFLVKKKVPGKEANESKDDIETDAEMYVPAEDVDID